MMQQQVYQQDATMQEQIGQQMVLCPVRFVYETQMLMQPGEQIQQPQTILINPQNPPPWIQNRPVQNRVIYVQQVPGGYIPSQQQHIDQNQLYIQNYGYQNVPQVLVQNQEQRMQMIAPNIMTNVQPNIQTNIGPVQNPNVQRIISNVPMQNQMNMNQPVNQPMPINRQIISSQMISMNEVPNNVDTQEMPASNIYRQTPQIIQDPRFSSQTITMTPNNMQNGPRYETNTNVCQIRPTQPMTQPMPPYPRPSSVAEPRKLINKATNFNTMTTNVRTPTQMLRPIQPRPNQIRPNTNFLPIQPANSQSTANSNRKIMPNLIPATNMNDTTSRSVAYNRKRKSESPDEIHKKIPISNTSDGVVLIKQVESAAKVSDVGVNTSPIHKADGRIIIHNMQITPITASNQGNKMKEAAAKHVRNTTTLEPQDVVRNAPAPPAPSKSFSSLVEKEKLIRNTVYTQARGRVLSDKAVSDVTKQENSVDTSRMEITCSSNENRTAEAKPAPTLNHDARHCDISENKTAEPKQSQPEVVKEAKTVKVENKCAVTENITPEQTPQADQARDTNGHAENETAESKTQPKIMKEIKKEKNEDAMDVSPVKKEDGKPKYSKIKQEKIPKEERIEKCDVTTKPDVKVKEDRDFILTHVLGGFVIQESNVAFPIRKPLKEKTLEINEVKQQDKDKDTKEIKNTSKILDISNLNIEECENMRGSSDGDGRQKENPFSTLKLGTVKKWTAEQLSAHLSKYSWAETVSVLQEHEIDGESLSLVSKLQLISIGVSENHADIIADFIKK
ncbi:hypothetical protein KGM_212524 [Danaus plexippus plexippus]|uniref:Uncharacterized protein n=1 Tax=Danaus plexippus plexippus TaxID=278856 RepID=A0A212F999_DANPL|nr:hypothetical protein KGM_212524 [Danaus plexippus plexippus]